MSYSLLDIGRNVKAEGMGGLRDAARMAEQREATNKQLREAKKATEMQAMGTGAMGGAMMGAQMGAPGGPWGVAIGAGIGLLSGWLMS